MAGETSNDIWTPKVNSVSQAFIEGLLKEKEKLPKQLSTLALVIDDAIDRVYSSGRIPGRDLPADIFKQKPIKLAQNIYLPTKKYPHFNFKGKILGPKGNTLKRLHAETLCNISIKGRTSMRDEEHEEQLRNSGDPVHSHLNKNLHVEITTVAPASEAYARMAFALSEIRKYIIPDKNDEISQEQYREFLKLNPDRAKTHLQMSVFDKLRKLKNNNNELEEDEEDEEENTPPPKKIAPPTELESSTGSTAANPLLEKSKPKRAKPHQKTPPKK